MAIQIPEDLQALEELAATYPLAPATVFIESGRHRGVGVSGASGCPLEIEEGNTYVRFLTFPDGSSESLTRFVNYLGYCRAASSVRNCGDRAGALLGVRIHTAGGGRDAG